ncbi:dihydroorotate dehydrogenase electron transfer subunit [bacterium]|nr:dihydroorotate dehydrogenase electron transfer subunit [bacterium]
MGDSSLLTFKSEHIAAQIGPGQFMNILPPSPLSECVHPNRLIGAEYSVHSDYNPEQVTMLRRPLSLYRVRPSTTERPGELSVLFRVIGKGTRLIADLKTGQTIDVLGPLGKPYPLPESLDQLVFLIAGGFGIAPLIPLAELLSKRGQPVFVFWGVPDGAKPPLRLNRNRGKWAKLSGLAVRELQRAGIPSFVASDQTCDHAYQGTVCQLFQQYLDLVSGPGNAQPIIYTCGPEIMMKIISEQAQTRGWPCRVSLEKYMACGLGACMSCVCMVKRDNGEPSYARTCSDGPSFWGDTIVWEK